MRSIMFVVEKKPPILIPSTERIYIYKSKKRWIFLYIPCKGGSIAAVGGNGGFLTYYRKTTLSLYLFSKIPHFARALAINFYP